MCHRKLRRLLCKTVPLQAAPLQTALIPALPSYSTVVQGPPAQQVHNAANPSLGITGTAPTDTIVHATGARGDPKLIANGGREKIVKKGTNLKTRLVETWVTWENEVGMCFNYWVRFLWTKVSIVWTLVGELAKTELSSV